MIRRITSGMAACVIAACMTALDALTAERPALLELLKALNVGVLIFGSRGNHE